MVRLTIQTVGGGEQEDQEKQSLEIFPCITLDCHCKLKAGKYHWNWNDLVFILFYCKLAHSLHY